MLKPTIFGKAGCRSLRFFYPIIPFPKCR